jgi:hypothetical protein
MNLNQVSKDSVLVSAIRWKIGKSLLVGTICSLMMLSTGKAETKFYRLNSDRNPVSENYEARGAQEQSMWCWAACVQMALATQGVVATQANIAASVQGFPFNAPASIPQLLATLQQISYDPINGKVVSTAACYLRDRAGNLVFNGAAMNPAAQAFLLSYGIPSILLLRGQGNIGHFVVVSGVSFDEERPNVAVSYEIRDPWPIDELGNYDGTSKARKTTMPGDEFRSRALALIVPFTICSRNERRMRALVSVISDPERLRDFSMSDLNELSGNQSRETTVPRDDSASETEWKLVDADEVDDFEITTESLDWGDLRSGDVTQIYRLKNTSSKTKYKASITTVVLAKNRKSKEILRDVDRQTKTVIVDPNDEATVEFNLRWLTPSWVPTPTEMPSIQGPGRGRSLLKLWKYESPEE